MPTADEIVTEKVVVVHMSVGSTLSGAGDTPPHIRISAKVVHARGKMGHVPIFMTYCSQSNAKGEGRG